MTEEYFWALMFSQSVPVAYERLITQQRSIVTGEIADMAGKMADAGLYEYKKRFRKEWQSAYTGPGTVNRDLINEATVAVTETEAALACEAG